MFLLCLIFVSVQPSCLLFAFIAHLPSRARSGISVHARAAGRCAMVVQDISAAGSERSGMERASSVSVPLTKKRNYKIPLICHWASLTISLFFYSAYVEVGVVPMMCHRVGPSWALTIRPPALFFRSRLHHWIWQMLSYISSSNN